VSPRSRVITNGGVKHESRVIVHETWERSGDGWICRESERTEGASTVASTSAVHAKPVVAELRMRATKLKTIEPGAGFEDLEAT
jgi:hypothetical protein